MFERFTLKVRRVIYWSRFEASQFGSKSIETHHLLLGLMREDRELVDRLLKSVEVEAIRKRLESRFPPAKKVPVSMDLPLSHESKRALAYTAEEAEQLNHSKIGTGHLLLGLLREEKSAAAEILREQGMELEDLRQKLSRFPDGEWPGYTREELHRLLDELPEGNLETVGWMLENVLRHRAPSETNHALDFEPPREEGVTENVRRVQFFARYEASQFGSPFIETEHLLLGLLREDKRLAIRFLGSYGVIEGVREEIEQRTKRRDKVSTSVDIPMSESSQRVMAFSEEESRRLNHKHVGTEHVLLGLLREEQGLAAELLNKHGVTLEKVREGIPRSPEA